MSYLEKVMKPINAIGEISQNRMYDTTEAARVISCGSGVIRELCKAGDLEHKTVGLRYLIRGAALTDLAKRDEAARNNRKAKAEATKQERQRLWNQKHRERQATAMKSEQVGQIEMLDQLPKDSRVKISPNVYMQLRKTAKKMNIQMGELASKMLSAGLVLRD